MYKLISIAFSHYCEVGRFALTRAGLPFEEARYLPFFHLPTAAVALRRASDARADRTSSRYSTPILICPDSRVLTNSVAILKFALGDLFPNRAVDDDIRRLHDHLGPHTRRLAYGAMLSDHDLLLELARKTTDPVQATLFRAALPATATRLQKTFHIDPRGLERSEQVVREIVRWADDRLAEHEHLAGEEFSALDIYYACMLAPALVIQPEEGFGAWVPPLSRLPAAYGARARELRDRPSGRLALRVFRTERNPVESG